jgi:hypothetical protein
LIPPNRGKKLFLIDFANFTSCKISAATAKLSFQIRNFDGTKKSKILKAIPNSIQKLPNNILNSIQKLKDALNARQEKMQKQALAFMLEERKENFIAEKLHKNSKFVADKMQLKLIKDKFDKIKQFRYLKNKIIEENKETIKEITNTINDEITKQKIFPQEIYLLGLKILIPNKNLIKDPNVNITISALKIKSLKGIVVYVSVFQKQILKRINTVNDEKKGYFVTNLNFNLFPFEKVDFTISLKGK